MCGQASCTFVIDVFSALVNPTITLYLNYLVMWLAISAKTNKWQTVQMVVKTFIWDSEKNLKLGKTMYYSWYLSCVWHLWSLYYM